MSNEFLIKLSEDQYSGLIQAEIALSSCLGIVSGFLYVFIFLRVSKISPFHLPIYLYLPVYKTNLLIISWVRIVDFLNFILLIYFLYSRFLLVIYFIHISIYGTLRIP